MLEQIFLFIVSKGNTLRVKFMIAVITGDIINSKRVKTEQWIVILKELLNYWGKEPEDWQIYRGDSFQIELSNVKDALKAAYYLKAGIKTITNLDVRMAVGLGEKTHAAKKITEANGSAFVNSGVCFEALRKQRLAIKTLDPELNDQMNLLLKLALLTMNHWSPTVASVIKVALENPKGNQKGLAKMLGKSPSTISEALKRGGFEEIMDVEKRYRYLIGDI
jgi:hypothetical protein